MSLQRNYYEVLGIPPGATTDQIKKKYRELARKFHPDVVQDKVLGQRVFTQINQAYRVLADPERRALYNSQLEATTPPRPAVNATPPAQARPAPPHPAAPRTAAPESQVRRPQTIGPPQTIGSPQIRPVAPAGQPGSAQKAQAAAGLLSNADNAIMAGKPIEARAFCIKVLEIDPKNARALEILGDALAGMGRREDAAVQYRNALAITPSGMIQAKLNRLEQSAPAPRAEAAPRTDSPGDDKPAGGLFGRLLGRKQG